jgi:hypothetical protein
MTTVTGTTPISRTETRRVPRTTGALSGLLVILLGIWGGLVPFFGPYFHYAFGSYQTWHYTSERLWLCIIPGAVAVIGGLMLMRSSHRSSGLLGGWLAMAAGAWFAIGPTISLLWHGAGDPIGAPMGGHTRQALEWLGYFTGLGVVIVALAAFAMGRYFSRPRVLEEAGVAGDEAFAADDTAAEGAPLMSERGTPVAQRDAPVAERDGPVAERDGPVAERGGPVAERGGPVAATAAGEPVAPREEAPVTSREDEPDHAGGEPLAPREEPLAPREPVSTNAENSNAGEQPAVPGDEPTDVRQEPAASAGTATGTPSAVTYRRRPGLLSRFGRR